MKKKYEVPQVEKIEFNYSDTVVASEIYIKHKDYTVGNPRTCEENYLGYWYGDAVGTNPQCIFYPAE